MVSGYAQMLSGLIDSYDPLHVARIEKEVHAHGGDSKIIDVPCYRLRDILRLRKISYVDYLSVDTEGSEFEVLQSIDFNETSIDLISVENNYKDDKIKNFLKTYNYAKIASIGGDDIYKKSSK